MQLLPFQEVGVEFLLAPTKSAYLADDMGLGKTVQAAAALQALDLPPVLVVCPASVVFGWQRHLTRVGYETTIVTRNTKGTGKAYITSYQQYTGETFRNRFKQWFEKNKPVVILDEAHYLKTPDTKRVRRMLGPSTLLLNASRTWLLSGTPITNRPMDLYPALAAFRPDLIEDYPSRHQFGVQYCAGYLGDFGWNFKGGSNLEELSALLDGWLLRRTKEEVMPELPELVVSEVPLDIPVENLDDTQYLATQRAELARAKASKISDYLKLKLDSCDKLLVFAYHKDIIELLCGHLSNYSPVFIHGGCTTAQRQQALDSFQKDPACRAAICQITAAGQGVDGLQTVCNYVVFAEPDWSPTQISQAIDRLRRIGQTKGTVFADIVVARRTLDRTVMAVSHKKRNIINQVIKGETIHMSNHLPIEVALERLVLATERLVQIAELAMSEEVTPVAPEPEVVEDPKPKAKSKAKAEPKEEPKEDVKPEPAVASKVTKKDVEDAAVEFIGTGSDVETRERHGLIVNVIFPQMGYASLAEVPENEYEYLVDMLKAGPDAYRPQPEEKPVKQKLSL